jgi:hypothetical protein
MLTPEQEIDLRTKSSKGLCHINGCNNVGKNKVSLTFATIAPLDPPIAGRKKKVQAVIPGWDCGEHRE